MTFSQIIGALLILGVLVAVTKAMAKEAGVPFLEAMVFLSKAIGGLAVLILGVAFLVKDVAL